MPVQVNFSRVCVFDGLLIAVCFLSNAMVMIVLGFDSRPGGGRRGFSSGFMRDYDGDREERVDRKDDGRDEKGTWDDVKGLVHFQIKMFW